MRARNTAAMVLGAWLAVACAGETKVYIYPDGYDPDANTAPGGDTFAPSDVFSFSDHGGKPDGGAPPDVPLLPDLIDEDLAPPLPDLVAPDVRAPVDLPLPEDRYEPLDVPMAPDLPPPPDTGPGCEPLEVPEAWRGTFDGTIVSNIPDMFGYTFNGPVAGEVRFEILCIEEKLMVVGDLDGGATNCALASGCPFTATMSGLFDPETQEVRGELLGARIDYTLVVVEAVGEFVGSLVEGPTLDGMWIGEKTGITPAYLDWVTATGEGTWQAEPSPL